MGCELSAAAEHAPRRCSELPAAERCPPVRFRPSQAPATGIMLAEDLPEVDAVPNLGGLGRLTSTCNLDT